MQTIFPLFFVALTSAFSVSLAAADVIKCSGPSGNVLYTNTACGNDTLLERVVVRSAPAPETVDPIVETRPAMPMQTAWATKQMVYRTQPDTESIRAARLKVLSLDRPRIGMR